MNIFFCLNGISFQKSGIEIAALKRSEIFSKNKISNTILTLRLNFNQPKLENLFDNYNNMPYKPKILNLYESYLGFCFDGIGKPIGESFEKLSSGYFRNKKSHGDEYYNNNGRLLYSSFFLSDKSLLIEMMYDKFGILRLIRESKSNGEINKIMILKDNGSVSVVFDKEIDFFIWVFSKLKPNNKSLYILDRSARWFYILDKTKNYNDKVFLFVHSIHYSESKNKTNGYIRRVTFTGENKTVDGCITLTEKQKKDIVDNFPNCPDIYCIPHNFENGVMENVYFYKNEDKISVFSRLSKEKRIEDALDIFANLLSFYPNKKLYIYGNGPQKKYLIDYAIKLKIKESVFFEGFIDNPKEKMRESAITLITSNYEGFCLSILESLSVGTAVLSYDIDYGPSDMIVNNKTGFLIESGNIEKASEALIGYFNEINNKINYNTNCFIESIEGFSSEKVWIKWKNLIESL